MYSPNSDSHFRDEAVRRREDVLVGDERPPTDVLPLAGERVEPE